MPGPQARSGSAAAAAAAAPRSPGVRIRWRAVAATTFCCWLLFALLGTPAGWLLPLLGENLRADALAGSIWQGQAQNAQVGPAGQRVAIGALQWRFLPLHSLRKAAVCVELRSELGLQSGNGVACLRSRDSFLLEDLTLDLPAAATQRADGLQLRGSMLLHLARVQLQDGQLRVLEGRGSWQDAAVHTGTQWVALGELGLKATLDAAGVPTVELVDVGARYRIDLSY